MADQLSHPSDDGIEWTKATSKNGVPFEFGIKRTEVKDHGDDFKRPRALETYEYTVNWPVGDDTWKETSGELHRDWISRYKLHDNGVSIYDYRLDFTSLGGGGFNYFFYDETGDSYRVFVVLNGDHYVRYNSDKPTIVRVEVSLP